MIWSQSDLVTRPCLKTSHTNIWGTAFWAIRTEAIMRSVTTGTGWKICVSCWVEAIADAGF